MINQLEQIRETRKWGNSGGVLLPREWIGKQVKIVLIDRTEEIKKEVFDILSPYLADIQGIYLIGSYARNEQNNDSDIDILAVSNSIKKVISSGKYNIQIYTLQGLKNTLKNYPVSIYPSILEAKPIMNKMLLEEFQQTKITRDSFLMYLEECKRVLNINKKIIELESKKSPYLKSLNIVYSLLLRLRGLYLMESVLENKNHSKIEFYNWIQAKTNLSKEELSKAIEVYENTRDNKKVKAKLPINIVFSLIELLESKLKKYDKPQKKTAKRN